MSSQDLKPTAETSFADRHIGPRSADILEMLETIGCRSMNELLSETIPESIRSSEPLDIGAGDSEPALLKRARELASKNRVYQSFLGLGYYGTRLPSVIQRNILENPAWYTAYTPYQAEISQGRMEALLNFQTMVMELTGLDLANASLLDEGTAAAEAMFMAFNHHRKKRSKFFVADNIFPQTLSVLQTRAQALDIELVLGDPRQIEATEDYFGALFQYPDRHGYVEDLSSIIESCRTQNIVTVVAADLLALTLLKTPGDMGADVAVGSSQRFGVPMGFGGPHAAFFAARDKFRRSVPGRFIGVSQDRQGRPALRLALQTREQHIRREKATSNICTSQVLLAVLSSMYAVYHGPEGLKNIAQRVHNQARALKAQLDQMGYKTSEAAFFDTIAVNLDESLREKVCGLCEEKSLLLRQTPEGVALSIDETTTLEHLNDVLTCFAEAKGQMAPAFTLDEETTDSISSELRRRSAFLQQSVFHKYRSETEILRYIHRLQQKDLALTDSMIPLGSCTMKLNATTEMIPITWPEFSDIHPFAPLSHAQGYLELISELKSQLREITGFAEISLQPNAGSQGEYAGLLVIRRYHEQKGEEHRKVCLIPSSAHGTNPASAVMAGFQVVVVQCDDNGNIDIEDLRAKATKHKDSLAALMVTYPSTHGVFEEEIRLICQIVHENGGQVYMDGANLNALVGLCRPGEFGPDVAHLNLHKTFAIPHGGGGPGMGPIGVASHLKDFLPTHPLHPECGPKEGISPVSAAPWGSASILPISWAYIRLLGSEGLRQSTEVAILNANYIAKRLEPHYPILYRGRKDRVAHECIIDLRPFKYEAGVEVFDVAKRLMDFGFHSPTMSWPVPGTLMIEPTESESKEELDRFCEAMIQIRKEIDRIAADQWPKDNNPLVNAPHTARTLVEEWSFPYSRQEAVYPLTWVEERKFWPSVARVNDAYGDKNFVCSCAPLESYQSGEANS